MSGHWTEDGIYVEANGDQSALICKDGVQDGWRTARRIKPGDYCPEGCLVFEGPAEALETCE